MMKINNKRVFDILNLYSLTKREVTQICDITELTYEKWKSGLVDVPFKHLVSLANYMDMPVLFFMHSVDLDDDEEDKREILKYYGEYKLKEKVVV